MTEPLQGVNRRLTLGTHGSATIDVVAETSSNPRMIDLWLKRRRPAERAQAPEAPEWMLLVCYRAGGNEYAARLGLSSGDVALRVDRLLAATRMGNRAAAGALFACLHTEWGQGRIVRHSSADVAWEAVLRYLAPLAADAGSKPIIASPPAEAPAKP